MVGTRARAVAFGFLACDVASSSRSRGTTKQLRKLRESESVDDTRAHDCDKPTAAYPPVSSQSFIRIELHTDFGCVCEEIVSCVTEENTH